MRLNGIVRGAITMPLSRSRLRLKRFTKQYEVFTKPFYLVNSINTVFTTFTNLVILNLLNGTELNTVSEHTIRIKAIHWSIRSVCHRLVNEWRSLLIKRSFAEKVLAKRLELRIAGPISCKCRKLRISLDFHLIFTWLCLMVNRRAIKCNSLPISSSLPFG